MRSMVVAVLLLGGCMQEGGGAQIPEDPYLPLPANMQLTVADQIGSPVPDPTGIAFDGQEFWLVSGGHNSPTHHLVRYNDTTHTVTSDFTFDNLIENLGTGVYGIEWADGSIWISVSGNTNKLVAVDPMTGAIERTWGSPTDLGPSDLSFDGVHMWIGNGGGTVFAMDLDDGGVDPSLTFSTGAAFIRDNGILARTGQVLANGLFDEGIALFAQSDTAVWQDPLTLGPMCFARGQIAAVQHGQIVFYDVQ